MGTISIDLWEHAELLTELADLRIENAELRLEIGRLHEAKKVWSDFEQKLP